MSALKLQRAAAHRIACAVVLAEVRRIRETDLSVETKSDWPESMLIGEQGLGLDSLEQLGALGALAETFDLDDNQLNETPPLLVADWVDWIMQAHATSDGCLTVRTSGSTGSPQPCVHIVWDLLNEADFFAKQLTDRRRVVALVPANHLYGMVWTALLPVALKTPVVVRKVGGPLGLLPGDLMIAVPEQWQAILRLTRRFPNDVIGVSSAGPLDTQLATNLLSSGLARMIDVYGSSETSAVATREMPNKNYSLLPRWRLIPSGEDWDLIDKDGRIVPLPDLIERYGERLLRPVGRRDGAVQIAGHNVWPERVAQTLRTADGVADVAVRLHTNGRLKAFVVPMPGRDQSELEQSLQQYAANCLSDPERPKTLNFGPELPRNAMGKLSDWV